MNVGILVFDEVELLDMAGPYEVFTTAARVLARSQPPGTPSLVLGDDDRAPTRPGAGPRWLASAA